MKSLRRLMLGSAFAIAALLAAGNAQAGIAYTTGGIAPTSFPGPVTPPATAAHILDGQGYPGDTVGLLGYSGTLDLSIASQVLQINTLQWTVNWTYAGAGDPNNPDAGWVELLFNLALPRTLQIGASSNSISQAGTLEVNWDTDYLTLLDGPTTTFYEGGYQVDVTPIGIARLGADIPNLNAPWVQADLAVMARFDVTAVEAATVPEPSSMITTSLLSLVFGGAGWWRKRKSAD